MLYLNLRNGLKQGEVGRRKLAQFTRYFTIVLGFIQAFGMSYGFNNMAGGQLIENPGVGTYLLYCNCFDCWYCISNVVR